MKKLLLSFLLLFTALLAYSAEAKINGKGKGIINQLKQMKNVASVKEITASAHFKKCYELWFTQHTKPNDASSETFQQRVIFCYAGKKAPVVITLAGYEINGTGQKNELADIYKANYINIEHRYFANSKPKSGIPWKTLTNKNAAHDQHLIIQAFRNNLFLENAFVSTGISKGGQTAMIHRMLYPEDVQASVCYVAPLNFQKVDPRIQTFLNTVGTAEQRQKIEEFQTMCFKQKPVLINWLDSMATANNYSWSFGTEKAVEYYILEYPFAFWQWGSFKVNEIPKSTASTTQIMQHILKITGISFFEDSGVENLRPYFWAANIEMGIYDYDYKPFKAYLSQQKNYDFSFTMPEGYQAEFNGAGMKMLNDFIQNYAENMLFIYGGLDTWGATGVELGPEATARGLEKYVLKTGHHGTRIKDFNDAEQEKIVMTIANLMGAYLKK